MLARPYRLPGPCLPQALAGTTIYQENNLVIKARPNRLSRGRLAITVSPRYLPLAVKRNRLKRQLLAVVDPVKLAPGFDVVVLIRRPRG